MSISYKGYNINVDGDIYDFMGNYIEYNTSSLDDDASAKTKMSFAKKTIDSWVKDGIAAQGEITNVRKVGDKYTYILENEFYGIYDPKTGDYATFDKKPTLEYIKNFSMNDVSSDRFFQDHVFTDSDNNYDDSVSFVIEELAKKLKTESYKMPKIGYKMPTQSQLNRGFRR